MQYMKQKHKIEVLINECIYIYIHIAKGSGVIDSYLFLYRLQIIRLCIYINVLFSNIPVFVSMLVGVSVYICISYVNRLFRNISLLLILLFQ